MLKQTAVAFATTMFLAGCATGPKSVCTPDTAVPLMQAEVVTKSSDERKVIVLPVDLEFKDVAEKKIQSVIRHSLESQVVGTGTQLVDRKLANKLKDEIKLAEQSGRYNNKGVPIADLAVLTEVTSSDFSRSYSESYTYQDKKGKTHRVPAKCNYKVEVTAVAKVVKLPEMSLVKRIELSGDESIITDTRSSNCALSQAGYEGLAAKAAAESIDHSIELRSLLAASAPVMELRQCEAGTMVKIAVGSNKNVQPNAKVAFSKSMKNGEGEVETFAIGQGKVVNIPAHGIKAKYSWVGINEELATKIQKGDTATLITDSACTSVLSLECHAKEAMKGL